MIQIRRKAVLKFVRRHAAVALIFVSGALLVFFSATYMLSGEIYDYQDSVDGTHLPVVDAVVCLAGGRGRIAAAGDVWYHYWEMAHDQPELMPRIPVLYFSGMGKQANWNVLSKQFRRGVLQVLHREAVVIENESSNTDENARWLADYSKQKQWRKILLLTSSYHMKRARFIFGRVLNLRENPVDVETLSVYQEPFTSDEWRGDLNGIRVTLMEYLKWVYYRSFW
jgi:uncharacterized SAM-binding protein YcdF (DUF218 family)